MQTGEPIFLLTLGAPAHGRGLKLPEGGCKWITRENLTVPETGNGIGFVPVMFYEAGGAVNLTRV